MPKSLQHIGSIQATVPILFIEEDSQWVAYCPPFEISSYGDTQKEAEAAFLDALEIFFEETMKRGTLEKELLRMGWTLASKRYDPPHVRPRVVHNLAPDKVIEQKIWIPTGSAYLVSPNA